MKLCYMVFVDDLIFFCGGDYFLMFMILRGFVIFFVVFGLEVNKEKLEVYNCNIDVGIMGRIIVVFGYKLGILFFRYLGIFISF